MTTATRPRAKPKPAPEVIPVQAGMPVVLLEVDDESVTFGVSDHVHQVRITRKEWAQFGRPERLWLNLETMEEEQ